MLRPRAFPGNPEQITGSKSVHCKAGESSIGGRDQLGVWALYNWRMASTEPPESFKRSDSSLTREEIPPDIESDVNGDEVVNSLLPINFVTSMWSRKHLLSGWSCKLSKKLEFSEVYCTIFPMCMQSTCMAISVYMWPVLVPSLGILSTWQSSHNLSKPWHPRRRHLWFLSPNHLILHSECFLQIQFCQGECMDGRQCWSLL